MRYTGPKCKRCRAEKTKLFLKGERCYSPKCPIERKGALPPGQHGQRKREKQKAKRTYQISETQFKNYFSKSLKQKANTGLRLLQYLESRLDNVIFKGGLVPSRSIARQLITHGSCLVNGKKVNIPSFQVKPKQTITFSSQALDSDHIKKSLAAKTPVPPWLERKAAVIRMSRLPQREEVASDIDEQLIVEYYSR